MRASTLGTVAASAAIHLGIPSPRFVMYFDQWHIASLPNKTVTAGVTHVMTSFASSTIFNNGASYTPFMPLDQIRALFDEDTKICLAIGGWGDTSGFSAGVATESTRKQYAQNVATTLNHLGYDCVDIDWEYPGGNGQDYRQIPNSEKVSEIETFPLLLAEIKAAIGAKELSIAVPGREEDMMAFTAEQVPKIDRIVDFVNVMTYDLMNRRMNVTAHHSSVAGSLNTVNIYIERGMTPGKMVLGFGFYAKWFTTAEGVVCTTPTDCPTAVLENSDGSDTGLSGAVTFEASTWGGALQNAMENGKADEELGGEWYWDPDTKVYWTWDTPEFTARKFREIVGPKCLGGAMAWALALDSHDWTHFAAMQAGVREMKRRGLTVAVKAT